MTAELVNVARSNVDPLVNMAINAHPDNRSHRSKWLRAIRYLRRRNLWLLDKQVARTTQAAA